MKNIFTKELLRSEILHMALLLIAAGVGGYILYQHQHEQVIDLTGRNTKLTADNKTQASKISNLQSDVTDLAKQNVLLQNEVTEYRKTSSLKVPQPEYSLQVNSVKQYSPPAYIPTDDTTYTLLVLDVSITNTGKAGGYVDPSDFIVKDTNNVSQQTMKDWSKGTTNVYLPPPQPVVLSGQALDAGDTVRGSLVFHVLTSQTSFTVKYNDKSFQATVDGKITL